MLAALVKEDCSVHAVAPYEPDCTDSISQYLATMDIPLHEVSMQRTGVNPIRDLKTFWELYRLMRREKPELVLPYTVKPVVWGLLAAWLSGVPHRFALITGLGYAFTNGGGGLVSRLVRLLYRLALSRAEKVFFQNQDDEALFRELGILPAHVPSVVVNGSGIDVAQFAVAPLPEKPVFLLIARLLGAKGVREYVMAARQIKAVFPQTIFRLVGWIDDNPDAISPGELDAWVNEGVVEYLGKLPDVRGAIQDASVYVLPSYREGMPRTVLEAMAMGRAIITSDAPGCRDTVIEGDNGFLVPVKNIEKLVQAMLRFIDRPELMATMGRRSREIAEDKYDVNKVNTVMLREMGIIK